MDFPFRRWSAIRRKFPFPIQVANTNLIRNRDFRVTKKSTLFTYSFLLKGRGFYSINGHSHAVEAPCAFVQYPGDLIDCGPYTAADAWHHFYLDYEPRFVPELTRSGLTKVNTRVLPLSDPVRIWSMSEELSALSLILPLESVVDRVDRLCERILFESQLPNETETNEQRAIERLLAKMQRTPHLPFDLKENARLLGMSLATFRRHWSDMVGVPPRRYHEQLRIQKACELLIESSLSVSVIAWKTGFQDEFYFSRRFRASVGTSPREYRNQHRSR